MLKHKYITLITRMLFIILITIKIGTSQSVNITPMVSPPYPIHLEDILSFDYGIIITLNNFSNQSEILKLTTSLKGDNGVSVIIKEDYTPTHPIQLGPNGTVVLTSSDLQRLYSNITNTNVEYSGIDESTLLQSEKLPEGIYQICFKALDYNTGEIKSTETSDCTSFYVTDYDPPIITSPINEDYVTPINPQAIMFSWVSTGLPQFTRYKMEIVDMTLNNLLDPNDAFGNISIILHYQKQNLLQTNIFYDASMPNLLENHEYAIRITASDPSQTIAFKNNGQSEVISFKYKKSDQIVQGLISANELNVSNGSSEAEGGFGPKGNNKVKSNSSSLHSAYKGSDGGIFYVTTMTDEEGKEEVIWCGEHPEKGYAHIFHGHVNNNELKGGFTDIPKYASESSGSVTIEIKDQGKKLVVMSKHQGFSPNVLTAINLEEYINWLPPAENNAAYFSTDTTKNLTGFYLSQDGGRFHVRQIDDLLTIYGETVFKKGEKPKYSTLFKGKFTGQYDKTGDDKTKIFYGFTQYFNKGTRKFYNDPKIYDKVVSANHSLDGMKLDYMDINGNVTGLTRKYPAVKGIDPPKAVPKNPIDKKPKAEKSAAFVLFHFDDGPFATLFQNIGTDLNLALDNYDYKVVMKTNYLGLNADKEINTMTKAHFLSGLKKLALDGYYIDLFIFTHGARDWIPLTDKVYGNSEIKPEDLISELGSEYGMGDFPLRMVYQMNCYGSAFIEAFLEVGAKAVCGANRVNYLPTQYNKFGEQWQAGASFKSSITTASSYWYANTLAATGININLKWKIGNPLSWDCKPCPLLTSIKDKNDCLACYYKSFWGWEWIEYDYTKTGLGNLYESSRQIVKGNENITINTKPKW